MTNAENLRFDELISNLQSVIDQIKGTALDFVWRKCPSLPE